MNLTQAMYAVSVGALNNEQRLDVLANNLANINTPGFKQDRLIFRVPIEKKGDSPTDFLQGPSAQMPYGAKTDFSQGVLRHTDNPLDLALDGTGFFCIKTPEGIRYTRNGSFSLNENGVLVTKRGDPVLGKSGKIDIMGGNVMVDQDGNISVEGIQVATLKIVTVSKPQFLKKVGNTLFALDRPGLARDKTDGLKVRQGYVEESNVNGIRVMTEMTDISRSYESYQKVIQFLSDATKKSVERVGRLA